MTALLLWQVTGNILLHDLYSFREEKLPHSWEQQQARKTHVTIHLQKTGSASDTSPLRPPWPFALGIGHFWLQPFVSELAKGTKQILLWAASEISLQNWLCKKGWVLGVLPLRGTEPGIVRVPSEATWEAVVERHQPWGAGGWKWDLGVGLSIDAGIDAAGWWWCPGVELLLMAVLGWIWDRLNWRQRSVQLEGAALVCWVLFPAWVPNCYKTSEFTHTIKSGQNGLENVFPEVQR